jgi:hypothetical protein
MQERIEGLSPEHVAPLYDANVESDARSARRAL